MKEQSLVVSIAPHIQSGETTQKIMVTTIIALLPTVLGGIYLFGVNAIKVLVISVAASVFFEAAIQKIMRRDITIMDGSAVLMGVLFACILPATSPWWMILVGIFFGLLIGKHVYGGLGNNPFHPVLVGWASLRLSFPHLMDKSSTPLGILKTQGVDAVLEQFKYGDLVIGKTPGMIGEVSVIAILIGGIFLLWKGYITWHIPVSFLATVVAFSGTLWNPNSFLVVAAIAVVAGIVCQRLRYTSFMVLAGAIIFTIAFTYIMQHVSAPGEYINPVFHLLTGGLMLGAFFVATDPTTSPVTGRGMIVFAFGCGLITMIARQWGSWVEGIWFAILVMNGFTPLIDGYIRVAPFGRAKVSA